MSHEPMSDTPISREPMSDTPVGDRITGKVVLALMHAGAGAAMLVVVMAACTTIRVGSRPEPGPPTYQVHAVRFASLAKFPKRSLIAGAPATDSLDIAMMVWVVRGGGRTILVDAGFYRDKFMKQWKPADYVKPSEAIGQLGIKPEDVTDIVVSHIHWDHADGADLFPRATVWLQREEYEFYVTDSGTVKNRAIDADVAKMFFGLKNAGRVNLVNGDAQEIVPGISVFTGGKHTYASQYVSVATRSGTVVLASDNAYLYENVERRVAINQTLDANSNLAAQGRMLTIASSPRFIVPGHDPEVFTRFPVGPRRVARID